MTMETSKENVELCWKRWKEFLNSGKELDSISMLFVRTLSDCYEDLQKNWNLDTAAKFISTCENYLFPRCDISIDDKIPDYREFIQISPKLFAELASPDALAINDTDINNVLVNYGQVIRDALLKPITETCRYFSMWSGDSTKSETFTIYLDISKLTILEVKRLEEVFSDKDAVGKILDEILVATFFGDIVKQWDVHLKLTDISAINTTHEAGLPYLKVEIKGGLFYSYNFVKKFLELAKDNSEQVTKNPR